MWKALSPKSPETVTTSFFKVLSKLVPEDLHHDPDIYLYHRDSGTVTRVSTESTENPLGNSWDPTISHDGRFIAFVSRAPFLVPNDNNDKADIFVHDRVAGTTVRVSVDSNGNEANDYSVYPSISADGRYVSFTSPATNLMAQGETNVPEVYVHDLNTGITRGINIDSAGNEANDVSESFSLSPDGRYIVFASRASNLVVGDTNGFLDIFVRDTQRDITSRFSLRFDGMEADFPSVDPVFSGDGRYIAFVSWATNLVQAPDTNNERDIFIRAFPQPTVDSMSPDMLPIGATTPVTITGSHFLGDTDLVTGATVTNLVIVDENTITADFTIAPNESPGTRNLVVALPGTHPSQNTGATGNCSACFTVF